MPQKTPLGPTRLSAILDNLRQKPLLTLSPNLKSLKLSLAFQNDHFGARHFLKEHLPRIRYANPTLPIQVERVRKTKGEEWGAELALEFSNNSTPKALPISNKHSSTILKSLMDTAGTSSWTAWKEEARAKGVPLVPGEESEAAFEAKAMSDKRLPSLNDYRALQAKGSAGKVDGSKADVLIAAEGSKHTEKAGDGTRA